MFSISFGILSFHMRQQQNLLFMQILMFNHKENHKKRTIIMRFQH